MSCARPKEAPEKLQSAIAFAMSDWSALFTNGFEDWAGVVASSQTLGGCHLRSVERLAQRPSLESFDFLPELSCGQVLVELLHFACLASATRREFAMEFDFNKEGWCPLVVSERRDHCDRAKAPRF